MKLFLIHLFCFLVLFSISQTTAQTKTSAKAAPAVEKNAAKEKTMVHCGRLFIDKNGDGYNDNAPDDDGDGIPNCIDPDYKKFKMQKGKKACNTADCMTANETNRKNKTGPGNGQKGKK